MNSSLISIIVPVYNVEKYLPRCIESILGQTYTNFELILVDDGTPDRSGIICDRYAERDLRIKVIHKENGGVSSARNAGIDIAQGEWITFVDSDDWVSDDYLQTLLQPFEEHDCDLTVGVLEWRYLTTSSNPCESCLINVNETQQTELLNKISRYELQGPCLKLFSMEIIKNNDLRFIEGIKKAEDAIFVAQYLRCCKAIFFTGKTIYYYNFLNTRSVSRAKIYNDDTVSWFTKYIESYEELLIAWNISANLREKALADKAYEMCVLNIKDICGALDETTAKFKITSILPRYKKWFTNNEELVCASDFKADRMIFSYIIKEDTVSLYECFKITIGHVNFIKKAKRTVKKMLISLLEKYRDGLIKMHF